LASKLAFLEGPYRQEALFLELPFEEARPYQDRPEVFRQLAYHHRAAYHHQEASLLEAHLLEDRPLGSKPSR
jgi:hypothetical protein